MSDSPFGAGPIPTPTGRGPCPDCGGTNTMADIGRADFWHLENPDGGCPDFLQCWDCQHCWIGEGEP